MAITAHSDVWQVGASRAAHPAVTGDEHAVYVAIAEGLGAVAVPRDLTSDHEPGEIERDLVLQTPAYDVWSMGWPAGHAVEWHRHSHIVAIHVVSGQLAEDRLIDGVVVRRILDAGSTVHVPAGVDHALANVGGTTSTTVHVHARHTEAHR